MQHINHTRTPGSLSLDTVIDLLGDRRRRHVVAVLADREAAVGLRSLARAVAARETELDEDPGPPTGSLAVALHHVHLPKLAAAGVVEYDHEANEVVPLETGALVACLDATPAGGQSDPLSAR